MKQRIAPAGAGIVLELQREASGSSVAVSDLLRKALLVARTLKAVDQETWIQSELNGYADVNPNSFPSYRLLADDIKCYSQSYPGTFVNIPSLLSEAGLDFYEKQLLKPLYGISVYEIERLLKYRTKNGEVSMPCPSCAEAAVKKLTGVPSPITLVFQEYSLTGILDAVRKKIEDWTSELEENGIIVEDPPAHTGEGEPVKDMLDISEAAKYSHVCTKTIRNWLTKVDGDKPMIAGVTGKGRLTRIPKKSLTPYIKKDGPKHPVKRN